MPKCLPQNAHLGLRAKFAQQVKIKPIIVVAEKGLCPTVATLCDVVGQVRDHHARHTGHRRRFRSKSDNVNFVHCHRNRIGFFLGGLSALLAVVHKRRDLKAEDIGK